MSRLNDIAEALTNFDKQYGEDASAEDLEKYMMSVNANTLAMIADELKGIRKELNTFNTKRRY